MVQFFSLTLLPPTPKAGIQLSVVVDCCGLVLCGSTVASLLVKRETVTLSGGRSGGSLLLGSV